MHCDVHILRRNQPHVVTDSQQFTAPEVRAVTSLYPDETWRKLREEPQYLAATKLSLQHRLAMLIDTVDLEHVLCNIKADHCCVHGDSFSRLKSTVSPLSGGG